MSIEKEDLNFRFIETSKAVFLYFSDGNVISADEKGIVAYSTTKTVIFESNNTSVYSTYIKSIDDNQVTVFIMPNLSNEPLGLSNDTKLENGKTVRTYTIKQEHYDKIKKFIWKQSIEKEWPDD